MAEAMSWVWGWWKHRGPIDVHWLLRRLDSGDCALDLLWGEPMLLG